MNTLGFSLVEVIIAALLLALTTASILFVFSTEKGVLSHTGRRVEATSYARQTAEVLKNAVDGNTWDGAGALSPGGPYNDPLPAGELRDTFGAARSYDVANGPGGSNSYREVTVTVNWEEPTE